MMYTPMGNKNKYAKNMFLSFVCVLCISGNILSAEVERSVNYFLRVPNELVKEIYSYISFEQQKEARMVCKAWKECIEIYYIMYPLKHIFDFLVFDYYMRYDMHRSSISTAQYLYRLALMEPKVLCKIYFPPIKGIGKCISIEIVLMKQLLWKKVIGCLGDCSVKERDQLLQKKYSINDRISTYAFVQYNKEQCEICCLGYTGMIFIFDALYKKNRLTKKAFYELFYACIFPLGRPKYEKLKKWMYDKKCEKIRQVADDFSERKGRLVSSFICKNMYYKNDIYAQAYLPLFINKQIPIITVKDSEDLSIELQNTLALDDDYKKMAKKFCSFDGAGDARFAKKIKENVHLGAQLLFRLTALSLVNMVIVCTLFYMDIRHIEKMIHKHNEISVYTLVLISRMIIHCFYSLF